MAQLLEAVLSIGTHLIPHPRKAAIGHALLGAAVFYRVVPGFSLSSRSLRAKFYDIDDAGKNWFLITAARKWKEFKATLKEQYFDENLTDEELMKRHGDRVNDEDWNFLVRTEIAKANRAKLEIHHTAGTKSFACFGHEMVDELGRPPRRDELYIKTHTRKNGVAIRNAEPIISKLKATVEARLELTERTIQQGDVFAAALGSKELRGRVRALGLGPTPQDVGIAGLKCYTPTRFQMEVLARKKAESRSEALEQRLTQMEAQMQMMEKRFAQERQNIEVMSQNGSNSQRVIPRSAEHVHEAYHDAHFQEDKAYEDNESNDAIGVGENLLVDRRTAAPTMQSPSNAALVMQPRAAPSSQCSPTNLFPAV
ncbi:uncharacterized protein [Miscanthus floridulus]|uniref:uncharacterized protein n=1 Tax=Miscanthus floridulus TaxID=154761 RepID=UPI00345903BC